MSGNAPVPELRISHQYTLVDPVMFPGSDGIVVGLGVETFPPSDGTKHFRKGVVILITVMRIDPRMVGTERTLDGIARRIGADMIERRKSKIIMGRVLGGPNTARQHCELVLEMLEKACADTADQE